MMVEGRSTEGGRRYVSVSAIVSSIVILAILTATLPASASNIPASDHDRFDNSTCRGNPAVISNANYLIYNRINKAGSTTMQNFFRKAKEGKKKSKPRFDYINVQASDYGGYFPNAPTMLLQLGKHTEQRKTVYINHAFLLPQLPLDKFAWINVARDPLERLLSAYYYKFDIENRSPALVNASMIEEMKKGKCGCYKMESQIRMEFGDCIEAMVNNNCPLEFARAQYSFFCPAHTSRGLGKEKAPKRCGSEEAIANIRRMYSFIGLTSQLSLSMDVFAKLVPKFMSEFPTYMAGSNNHFKQTTRLPGASQKRVLSDKHKALLESHWVHYANEVAVYKEIQRLFWCKVNALGLNAHHGA